MSKQKLKFPEGFLWGAATAAHQIEGHNTHSDWWAWEHSEKRKDELRSRGLDPANYYSGVACDSYNRFEEDFDLAQHLNQNAHRLSIEWARVEPREGFYDQEALDHYEQVFQSAKAHGLSLFVTLHHYTCPKWLMDKGGFENKKSVGKFVQYAQKVAESLGEYVDFWLTFNEPEMYSTLPYVVGVYPPQKRSIFSTIRVARNLISAHNQAALILKHITRKPVSMAYHLSDLQPANLFSDIATEFLHYMANEYILRRTIAACDFIGVNYYFHHHISLFGRRKHSQSRHNTTDLGWGIHPEGLERVLLNLRKHKKPIYITENGLADAADKKREKFIKDHLYYAHRAMRQGADVRGYLHWSLIDNFEWEKGFGPRFGLIEIDREDMLRRRARYSAVKYAEICRDNFLEVS